MDECTKRELQLLNLKYYFRRHLLIKISKKKGQRKKKKKKTKKKKFSIKNALRTPCQT